jgi:hypothetical protein
MRWLAVESHSTAAGNDGWQCSGGGAGPATCMDGSGEV